MSAYYTSFTHLGQNSSDLGWIVAHFEGDTDSGEMDSFLSTSTVSTDMYNGTKKIMYGSKYDNSAVVKITVIKRDGTDFNISDNRKALKWLTGAQQNSWMYFYIGNEDRELETTPGENAKFRMLGHVQDVKQYKIDAGIWGLVIYFESASPWAFSPLQTISQSLTGTETITITNGSDDKYTYTPVNVTYTNTSGNFLTITNNTTGDVTKVTDLAVNETIYIKDNLMITSDKPSRVFGNSFNFVFPRLQYDTNELVVDGTGNIKFEYYYCIKLGDCATEVNATYDPICNSKGEIAVDTLDFSRISNLPTTLSGYKIQDAYTKSEVDQKVANVTVNNVYTKSEIDTMLENFVSDDVYTKTEIDNNFYTKPEVDALLAAIQVNIDETELNAMLAEVLV